MNENKERHLYEIEHPYYCNEGNYFSGSQSTIAEYKSWSEFLDEEGDSDFDMNLLFRWDWEEGGEDEPKYNGDPNYRNGRLKLFWMGQRKGLYRWSIVEVCRNDEPVILEYLKPRWEHMKTLWEGIEA